MDVNLMDGCMAGQMFGGLQRRVDGWMDGWTSSESVAMAALKIRT